MLGRSIEKLEEDSKRSKEKLELQITSMKNINAEQEELLKRKDIKQKELQAQVTDLLNQMSALEAKLKQVTEDETVRRANKELEESVRKMTEIVSRQKDQISQLDKSLQEKTSALSKSKAMEEFYRGEVQKKETELVEKKDSLRKMEAELGSLQLKNNQLMKDSMVMSKKLELAAHGRESTIEERKVDPNQSFGLPGFASSPDHGKTAALEETIDLQNQRIKFFTREIDISKSINQTLVNLLKWKNIEIQYMKELEKGKNDQDIQRNIDKFKSQEKTLLTRLEQQMKQLEELEIEKAQVLKPKVTPSPS
eukprot:TRINITY_DN5490_c0_g1_i1.p1 TRINITY_DN5490_c0_g1~~TRINITY_DN5490_c0_g1_i1.p1  ORF type:complete len:309 (-),score=106.75 TRINITY_DN5490_c0_g1_i1:98-1024(-)